jgi:hypothetical protein
MGWTDWFSGKKDSASIQAEIADLDKKYAEDKAALQQKLQDANTAEATTGVSPQVAGRRKHKKTRRHRSKRARTGRRSTRL